MAYLIFTQDNNLISIAENDLELQKVLKDEHNSVSVSDENFNFIKYSEKSVSYDGVSVSYTEVNPQITSVAALNGTIESTKKSISNWLEKKQTHTDYSKWNDYLTQINNVVPSAVFSSLSASDAWYDQIGTSGETNDKKYVTKTEVDSAENNGETVTKTDIIGCSLEKYFNLNSQTSLSLLQLPLK
tara:strand:+ start:826 stop:1383 length:558 start_codon:yes stop_codon:yes gene_type:complete